MKKLFCFSLLVFFVACTATKLIQPTQADVDRISTKYPGYSLQELQGGKVLFEQTCSRCHKLKNPASKSEKKWEKIVPTMIGKLTKKEGRQVIDAKQQDSILRYLVTMSSAPKSEK